MKDLLCDECDHACILCQLINDKPDLQEQIHLIHYDSGETIFQEGSLVSGCYIVCRGKVKLLKRTRTGKRQVLKLLTTGDMLGEIDMFRGQHEHQTSAKALTETHVGFIERRSFLHLLEENPSLTLQMFQRFTQKLDAMQQQLVEVAYGRVRDRVIRLLLSLEERHSRDEKNGRYSAMAMKTASERLLAWVDSRSCFSSSLRSLLPA